MKGQEADIQTDIKDALLKSGLAIVCKVKTNGLLRGSNGRRYSMGQDGMLDLYGMTKTGRYFEIEVKMPGEKPTIDQKQRIEKIQRYGGIAGWATSIDEALEVIE